MGLIQGSTRPFRQALKVLSDLGFNRLDVDAPGQEVKVRAALRRGDKIPEAPVKAAIKAALEQVWGEDMDPFEMREAVEDAVEDAVRGAIEDGLVQGPKRETPSRTGKKLYDTGDLKDSITVKATR